MKYATIIDCPNGCTNREGCAEYECTYQDGRGVIDVDVEATMPETLHDRPYNMNDASRVKIERVTWCSLDITKRVSDEMIGLLKADAIDDDWFDWFDIPRSSKEVRL